VVNNTVMPVVNDMMMTIVMNRLSGGGAGSHTKRDKCNDSKKNTLHGKSSIRE